MASTQNYPSYIRQNRQFGTEITNNINNNTPGLSNNNAKTGKSQQQILQKMHKSRSSLLSNNNNNQSIKNKQEEKIKQQALEELDLKKVEKDIERIDLSQKHIPESVQCYTKDIFKYLKEVETKHNNTGDGMSKQREVNEKMRSILIDWLADVHLKYRMLPETLFITVALIDKYLEKNQISRSKLQLLGITSLFIAGKYEEIYPPHIKDYVEITDRVCSKYEILEMEGKILLSLDFNLTFPSAFRFLNRYATVMQLKDKAVNLARYILELSLIDNQFVSVPESKLAAAALYLSLTILKEKQNWSETMQFTCQYKVQDIRTVARKLTDLLLGAPKSKFQAIRRKFASEKYGSISKIELVESKPQQQQ